MDDPTDWSDEDIDEALDMLEAEAAADEAIAEYERINAMLENGQWPW